VRLTPRSEEVAEVVALLERDDYPTAEALAKDIIKQVAEFFWFRTWYVLVLPGVAFGPFASDAEAVTFGRKYKGIIVPVDPSQWGVRPVYGLGGTAEERVGGGFGYCATDGCGHAAWAHKMVSSSRGACGLSGCGCGQYAQAKPKPRARKSNAKKSLP
jgi:hypothetical protein